MSEITFDEHSLKALLLSALDGDAADAELARLNDALRGDEGLRRAAARFLCDDAFLAEEIGTIEEAIAFLKLPQTCDSSNGEAPAWMSGTSAVATTAQNDERPRPVRFSVVKFARRRVRSTLEFVNSHGIAVAAAAIFVAMVLGWHYTTMLTKFNRLYALATHPDRVGQDRSATGARQSAGATTVARVTGVVDCKWPEGQAALEFGDQLAPGQKLRLTEGLLQLTFNTGAKVVVEGPADFVASAPTEATLLQGKIAAAVPRFARGYTVLTPTAEIVDLGTEFGIDVDDKGASEVHVFDGDVVARPRSGGVAEGELVHARRDEAIHFDPARQPARRISADRERFVRRITPDRSPDDLPPLPITHDLALWLAADVMPVSKDGAAVSTWPDILIGENQFPDDAWQFDERLCPTWIRDAQGQPAVRFDGWSTYMLTSPMATGDRQTVFVVFACSPASFASESHGGMLLQYGLEAPSLELALLPNRSPRGRVWAGNDDGSTSNVGVLNGNAVEPHVPCAIAYTYDVANNRAELAVDGKSLAATDAPKRIEQHAKKYIGSHAQPWYEAYFLGNIYEIIIYDTALDAGDRDRVFQYLSNRYASPAREP